ncbi:MAG: hypothetical protein IPN29_17465 [Saprospiraceae bacterium]|nr:hypothetical protein [Saprospiraceae bacterium]
MKNTPLLLTCLLFSINILAQTPRIALVKPNGITTIHSTLSAAYNAASDDDFIYLPGGNFENIGIQKKIHIIGAGSNLDSSNVTGITRIQQIHIYPEASGGSIEGIYFYNQSGSFIILNPTTNFEIRKCRFDGQITTSGGGESSNLLFSRNQITDLGAGLVNSIFKNNIILFNASVGNYCQFNNNIFFYPGTNGLSQYCTFKNNIFMSSNQYSSYSFFYNNVNCNVGGTQNENYNNVDEPWSDIFINPGTPNGTPPIYQYDVHNNYHVKVTSACHNSGTDGTDRGIYGGPSPWVEGSIPSNPHIYFKQVAEETNANGQLQIHFKVRTGN